LSTHYHLLNVDPVARPEEIRQAFRREIARYHPDKVQHLGEEFQQLAATRAAELTEAYRVLMDLELRQRYDMALAGTAAPQRRAAAQQSSSSGVTVVPDAPATTRIDQEDSAGFDVVRRAALVRVRAALVPLRARSEASPGLDAAFAIDAPKTLFRKSEQDIKLLVRVVQSADPAAVTDAWKAAARASNPDARTVCLLLLATRLSPARELAAAIAEQRRKHPQALPLVIPTDMRNWEALFPPDTPAAVRSLVDRLRSGE